MFKTKPVMLLDIGDNGVSGALIVPEIVKKSQKYISNILFSTRRELPWQDEVNLKRFLNDTAAALKQVLGDLIEASSKASLARPHEIACFLSAPFYASQSRMVRQSAPKPFIVSEKLVTDLIKVDLEAFSKNYSSLNFSIINDHQRVIESRIMQFKLNRYLTHRPYNKLVRELEIQNYVSIGSEKILARLEEIIVNVFHSRVDIQFHSLSFALFNHFFEPRALVVHLGTEVTEIFLINN